MQGVSSFRHLYNAFKARHLDCTAAARSAKSQRDTTTTADHALTTTL